MQTPEPFLLNPHHDVDFQTVAPGAEVRDFHRTLANYVETPMQSLPTLAESLGLGAVLIKDESSRLGLPAFKMLGASWAVHRLMEERDAGLPRPTLVTATDGNHGRAVAHLARSMGLPARVALPTSVPEKAVELIRSEGAEVEVCDLSYDDTVRHAAQLAENDPDALLVQDTSWPGYEDVPQWIVDGYATMFDEAVEQATNLGLTIDLMVVPAGVGSLAHAAVLFARARSGCAVVTVEPTVAACISASLTTGELTSVATGETSMAGLNCGTPAYLAWPDLRAGLAGATTVDDAAAQRAMADLAASGISSGPCGAASLAALRTLAQKSPREALGLTEASTVLLLNTEGIDSQF